MRGYRRREERPGAALLRAADGQRNGGGSGRGHRLHVEEHSRIQVALHGQNLSILPLALDQESWVARATDDWSLVGNDQSGAIGPGPDGKPEVNLFPQGTGSPDNRGTVDIGSNNNSTADLSRQILYGPTAADLAFHGGELKLDDFGLLYLNGDPSISAGVQDKWVARH